MSDASGILGQAWRALGGDAARLDRVRGIGLPPLPAVLPAARLVHDAIAAAALAAAELAGDDGVIAIDPARAATAVTSERWFSERGAAPDVWSPFSGFRSAADGWVRTHANYPHHRERLLHALDLPAGAVPAELADRIRSLPAREVEGLAERHGVRAHSPGRRRVRPPPRGRCCVSSERMRPSAGAPPPAPRATQCSRGCGCSTSPG